MTIHELIVSGEFDKAYQLIKDKDILKVAKELEEKGSQTSDISYYAFINFLNKDGKNEELHYLCSIIASTGINRYKGGYSIGYFHIQKAIELDPNNIEFKSFSLLFNEIPDKLMNDNLAKEYAKEILKKEPNYQIAKEILERD